MKWIKIELEIPEPVLRFYHMINKIVPKSCIAGGFLCDLYVNKPFKDIDIFIQGDNRTFNATNKLVEDLLKEKSIEYSTGEDFGHTYSSDLTFRVTNLVFEGYTIQLVFSPYGIKAVKHFDLRFREFIFLKGNCFASKEAIDDIHSQKLVFGAYHSPLRSLYRAIVFSHKYDFQIDPSSLNRFKMVFNFFNITPERFLEYGNKKDVPEISKNHFLSLLEENCSEYEHIVEFPNVYKKGDDPTLDWMIYKIAQDIHPRDMIEKMLAAKEYYVKTYACTTTHNPFHEKILEIKNDIVNELKNNRLFYLLHLPTYIYDVLHSDISSILDNEANQEKLIFSIDELLATINSWSTSGNPYEEIRRQINMFRENLFLHGQWSSINSIEISNRDHFLKETNEFNLIQRHDLIYIKVENFLGGFAYCLKDKKFIKTAVNETAASEMKILALAAIEEHLKLLKAS
jgi:hypothetical protein